MRRSAARTRPDGRNPTSSARNVTIVRLLTTSVAGSRRDTAVGSPDTIADGGSPCCAAMGQGAARLIAATVTRAATGRRNRMRAFTTNLPWTGVPVAPSGLTAGRRPGPGR